MSSLFQGLTEPDGRVKVTTSGAGAVPLRGLMVSPDGRVLIAEDTGQARVHHSGRAFDPATGALLVDPAAITEVLGMGGMTVDINGGVITKGVAPDVIHQGVGLTNEGYLAIDRGSPEGSVFYAPLSSNLAEVVAGLTPNYSRALEALYEPTPGQWAIAPDGVSRFESGYLLMEPAATNKCENYNANPDAGLTGYSITGGGVISRESASSLIAAAGLQNICTDGNVIRFETTTAGDCIIDGFTGNLNEHKLSAWIQNVQGSVQMLLQGDTGNLISIPATGSLVRYSTQGLSTSTTRRIIIRLGTNSIARFVLNQLEESAVLSTPIITRGASSSRSADVLTYPGINSVFNQAEGMVAVDWIPKHAQSDSFADIALATLQDVANILYYNASNDRLTSFDGVNESNVLVNPFSGGESFRAVALYGPAGTGADRLSAGVYQGSAWDWDTNNNRTYGGSFPATPDELRLMWLADAPGLIRNVTLWDVNQGRAWIEANMTP